MRYALHHVSSTYVFQVQYNTAPGTIVACPSCKGFNKLPDVNLLYSSMYLNYCILFAGSQRKCSTNSWTYWFSAWTSCQMHGVWRKSWCNHSILCILVNVMINLQVKSWCPDCGQWFGKKQRHIHLSLNNIIENSFYVFRLCLNCDIRLHARGKRAAHQVLLNIIIMISVIILIIITVIFVLRLLYLVVMIML